MNNLKTYYAAIAKLAALSEQGKAVTTKLHGIGQEQQAAQSRLEKATEQAAAVRGKVMRGTASDEELTEADTLSEKLFTQAQLDELRSDEQVCRNELGKLQGELAGARTAVSTALQKLCNGLAEQLGESLKNSPKLRAQLVQIYAVCSGAADTRLGAAQGGRVDWSMMLEELFPIATDAEFEAAYSHFKTNLLK